MKNVLTMTNPWSGTRDMYTAVYEDDAELLPVLEMFKLAGYTDFDLVLSYK